MMQRFVSQKFEIGFIMSGRDISTPAPLLKLALIVLSTSIIRTVGLSMLIIPPSHTVIIQPTTAVTVSVTISPS